MIGGKNPSGYPMFDVEILDNEYGWERVKDLPQTDDQFSNVPGISCAQLYSLSCRKPTRLGRESEY